MPFPSSHINLLRLFLRLPQRADVASGRYVIKSFGFRPARALALVLGLALLAVPGLSVGANSQTAKAVPENGQAGRYGGSFECKSGFRKQDESCLKVTLPDNAFLTKTAYGRGWDCHYGFLEKGDQCLAVRVPANAFLEGYSGDRWRCLPGYRQSETSCDQIKIPENAFLSDSTQPPGWECERGFRAAERGCVKLDVPAHAFLTTAGDEWRCNRGFEKKDRECIAVKIPDNASFVETLYGQKWKCDRDFEMKGPLCQQIKLPANAHLNSSGNAFDCNRPYRLLGGACIMD
jgi:hypothetical protein